MQNLPSKNKKINKDTIDLVKLVVGAIWACILVVAPLTVIIIYKMGPVGPIPFLGIPFGLPSPTATDATAFTVTSLPTFTSSTAVIATIAPSSTLTPTLTNIPPTATQLPALVAPIPFVPTTAIPNPSNLIINGSFADGYNGWTRELKDKGNSAKIHVIPFPSGDFGSALKLENTGTGEIYFWQDVSIPTPDLDFIITFQSDARMSPNITDWSSQSYISLGYLDSQNSELGQSLITNSVYKLTDTNRLHFFQIKGDNEMYMDFKINIRQEIEENLLGIQPSQVTKLRITLGTGAMSSGFDSYLIATDLMLLQK